LVACRKQKAINGRCVYGFADKSLKIKDLALSAVGQEGWSAERLAETEGSKKNLDTSILGINACPSNFVFEM